MEPAGTDIVTMLERVGLVGGYLTLLITSNSCQTSSLDRRDHTYIYIVTVQSLRRLTIAKNANTSYDLIAQVDRTERQKDQRSFNAVEKHVDLEDTLIFTLLSPGSASSL